MPSFQDSAVIFFLALLLFGPKKLPELARQLGKLMGEFRRASNEFRMQMEDELRVSEQEERKKQIAAIEAAAPVAPAISSEVAAVPENTIAQPSTQIFPEPAEGEAHPHAHLSAPAPQPIATSGDLNLMPPATGLPVARSASTADLAPAFASVPQSETQSETQPDTRPDAEPPPPPDRYNHLAPAHDGQGTLTPAETTQHG